MSKQALIFAEGYRGRTLETKKVMGSEYLCGGQHEAIWSDEDRKTIEVSWAHQLGHEFYVIMLMADDLRPAAFMKVGVFGHIEKPVPEDFELTEQMLAAITELRSGDAGSDQSD